MSRKKPLKAPYPYFGGKSAVVDVVWRRLGNPRNFIEPFFGSGAMLLRRPHADPQIETVNDLNAYISNFWRSIQRDPEKVAAYADWPVNEVDQHARHQWLVHGMPALKALAKVRSDPDYYDAKIAGWWCWGMCMWIGSGWCEERTVGNDQRPDLGGHSEIASLGGKLPSIGSANRGALRQGPKKCMPSMASGMGVDAKGNRLAKCLPSMSGGRGALKRGDVDLVVPKRPQLCLGNSTAGNGVHKKGPPSGKRPYMTNGGGGVGVTAPRSHKRVDQSRPDISGERGTHGRPQLADAFSRGRGVNSNDALTDCQRRRQWLTEWFFRLADRLRAVRVCCGHWSRVCDSDSTMFRLGLTGVFLDPPYRVTVDGEESRTANIYANDKSQDVDALCDEVQAWCLKWGGRKDVRIALCGYTGEYPKLEAAGWDKFAWRAHGGYGNRSDRGKNNRGRERILFSPHCLPAEREMTLFGEEAAA